MVYYKMGFTARGSLKYLRVSLREDEIEELRGVVFSQL
jgi:hypothetical protein